MSERIKVRYLKDADGRKAGELYYCRTFQAQGLVDAGTVEIVGQEKVKPKAERAVAPPVCEDADVAPMPQSIRHTQYAPKRGPGRPKKDAK